jgi:hypothetical protein
MLDVLVCICFWMGHGLCIPLQLVAYDDLLVSCLGTPICSCSLEVVECMYMCVARLYDVQL